MFIITYTFDGMLASIHAPNRTTAALTAQNLRRNGLNARVWYASGSRSVTLVA
jgi:hypothetical protein